MQSTGLLIGGGGGSGTTTTAGGHGLLGYFAVRTDLIGKRRLQCNRAKEEGTGQIIVYSICTSSISFNYIRITRLRYLMGIEVGGGGSALQIILWEAWEWKGRPPATESLSDAFPEYSIRTIKSAHTMQIFTCHFQSIPCPRDEQPGTNNHGLQCSDSVIE